VSKPKTLTIALAGNPNCGKTTIFNNLTGSNQKIGNWPGVTVEKKEGQTSLGSQDLKIVDLPGIYGLSATSEDEMVSRNFLMDETPDAVINLVDATNLERNLYLSLQILEMNIPTVMILTKMDLFEKGGGKIDLERLSSTLGIPVMAVNALKKEAIAGIKEGLATLLKAPPANEDHVPYPEELESALQRLSAQVKPLAQELGLEARWVAIRLFDLDERVTRIVTEKGAITEEEIQSAIEAVEEALDEEVDIVLADEKYTYIEALVKDSVTKGEKKDGFSEKLDKVVMSRIWGIPIFLGVMYMVFWFTLTVGGAFIDFFDIFFGTIFVDGFAALLNSWGTPEFLVVLLANGIGGGIQTVSTFIPIIFTMFFALSLLEDSGYMARAAFVMDRIMRKVGLPGKAFVPMLVGFGCTIPAVMATRTLDTKKDKFTTIFMSPLMSCGARLPVYALFSAALFPAFAGPVVFSVYIAGILISILTGILVKKTIFKGEVSNFVMELPPYHPPRFGMVFGSTWDRLGAFVVRAGLAITTIVVVITLMNNIGITDQGLVYGQEDTETSILSDIGKAITPAFTPMGIEEENWPATVGLFTGLFAKEAIVGTLNSLYTAEIAADLGTAPLAGNEPEAGFDFWGGIGESLATIPENLAGTVSGLLDPFGLSIITGDVDTTAEEVEADSATFTLMGERFDPLGGYAYLLFVLIYFPCVAAFGATVQEMGTKLGIILAVYLTAIGWAIATIFYQLTAAYNPLWIIVGFGVIVLTIGGFVLLGKTLEVQEKRILS
jgi:ferrous iron transport protein B